MLGTWSHFVSGDGFAGIVGPASVGSPGGHPQYRVAAVWRKKVQRLVELNLGRIFCRRLSLRLLRRINGAACRHEHHSDETKMTPSPAIHRVLLSVTPSCNFAVLPSVQYSRPVRCLRKSGSLARLQWSALAAMTTDRTGPRADGRQYLTVGIITTGALGER